MKTRILSTTVLLTLLLSFGCSALGTRKAGGKSDAEQRKGISATQICQTLAHPSFQNRSPYDGQGCSGSTSFGPTSSFSYAALGEGEVITRVRLNMTNRPDGAEFFAAEGDAVAKLINGQPLPNEIRNAIMAPLFASGGDFTTNSQIGKAKVELVRSATDHRYSLSFDF